MANDRHLGETHLEKKECHNKKNIIFNGPKKQTIIYFYFLLI